MRNILNHNDGISGYLIDYALIVINANTGIQKMTRNI